MDRTDAVDPVTGDPKCPHCDSVGDQPHASGCLSGQGWNHAIKADDEQL